MMNEVERAFELYGNRLYAYMRRLGLSEVEAEDGVQEVLLEHALQHRLVFAQRLFVQDRPQLGHGRT